MNHVDCGTFSIISGNVSFLSCDLGASTASLFLWLLHWRLFLLRLHIFYASHRLVTCSYLYALAPPFVNHAELTPRERPAGSGTFLSPTGPLSNESDAIIDSVTSHRYSSHSLVKTWTKMLLLTSVPQPKDRNDAHLCVCLRLRICQSQKMARPGSEPPIGPSAHRQILLTLCKSRWP